MEENLINNQLDIQKIKEEYQKDKFVVIRNFLQEESAEKLKSYYAQIPPDWWSWMFLPDPDLGIDSWGTIKKTGGFRIFIKDCFIILTFHNACARSVRLGRVS